MASFIGLDSIGGIVGSTIAIIIKVMGGLLALAIIVGVLMYKKKQKMYNIPVTIWIPRSDGKITDEVSAKGGFFKTRQPSGGKITTFRLKRKGQQVIDIIPPSSRFLVGLSRKLYLLQKGIDDFEPIDPNGFRYVTTAEGKKVPVTELKCINQDATAWVEDNRENAKRRFTFANFWEKYKDFIQITIFVFIVMLSIYINWTSMQEVVTGLNEVANNLQGATGGSVSVD